ncbi:hypothetical protein [Arachnia propionica]|uniref:NHLP leader peptide family natural product n=1 Tax=Arachnia propionica TaxID=1750 RepID=A0A3P1WXQ4_9ACTN|nr:hypothetical protein [Arachnia propionica]RRD50708.1 hypothetical protein EII35_02955 [Arachnia propionica]
MSEDRGFQEFTEAYAKLLVSVWTDEKVRERLKSDPHSVAGDAGLVIPADVRIRVVEAASESVEDPQEALKAYYGDFQKGLAAKGVTLAVPPAPELGTQELTPEELSAAAGGVSICCAPCCCCWKER